MYSPSWNVEYREQVGSTNEWLAERARAGAGEGLAVYCDYQSAGRGRLGREWRAAPGSALLCSALVSLPSALAAPQWMVVVAALSVCDTLEQLTGVRPSLKWPNDVLYGDLKVGGLLAEMVPRASATMVVIGLGLNLTDVDAQFVSATSVRDATGCSLDASRVLAVYLDALSARRGALDTSDGRETVTRHYGDALSTLGRHVRVELVEGVVRGLAIGVDHRGALRVETASGERVFSAGDVVHLRREDA